MSIFTLEISCLTSSTLPWLMDLTFQFPIQYCYLQHWALLSPPGSSTTEHHFCFGSATSFLLELFLCSSSVAYWVPTDLGSSSFSVIPFCLFILFMGFSRQECWSGLPFPSPVNHILSELSIMIHPPWVALHGMTHSFLWVRQGSVSMWSVWLIFCDCGFLSALWTEAKAQWIKLS